MHSNHTEEGSPSASSSDLDAAIALVAKEEQRMVAACAQEIQEVLARYGMSLEVSRPQIALVPKGGN